MQKRRAVDNFAHWRTTITSSVAPFGSGGARLGLHKDGLPRRYWCIVFERPSTRAKGDRPATSSLNFEDLRAWLAPRSPRRRQARRPRIFLHLPVTCVIRRERLCELLRSRGWDVTTGFGGNHMTIITFPASAVTVPAVAATSSSDESLIKRCAGALHAASCARFSLRGASRPR